MRPIRRRLSQTTARATANGSFRLDPTLGMPCDASRRGPQADSFPHSGFVNAQNKVPEHQRTYQAAYRAHTRIWRIVRLPDGHA